MGLFHVYRGAKNYQTKLCRILSVLHLAQLGTMNKNPEPCLKSDQQDTTKRPTKGKREQHALLIIKWII